jgi:hypothetical protein
MWEFLHIREMAVIVGLAHFGVRSDRTAQGAPPMNAVRNLTLALLVMISAPTGAISAPLFSRGIVGLPILRFTFENLP